ncbi:hypothetical protein AVEN_67702-1 [Araneus ventricosus]|uniref:Uncharacterized protein n=1 Tax=Araneus ventricosus TaxID=182803 RepID=A0A4Y2I578_ARAVE|nr:hypothetical protein AVEN_67702-1 [Araneus ventricosus]
MICVKLSLRESACLVISETVIFWQKAQIPFREPQHRIVKLEALYNEWRMLQKHSKRKSETQEQKEQNFKEKLEDLFDIAHSNALKIITIEEDKQFLFSQSQKGRIDVLGGIDKRTDEKEKRVLKRLKRRRTGTKKN